MDLYGGCLLIHAERRRQVEGEGWTLEHDDEHTDGELARAGGCYALAEYCRKTGWGDSAPPSFPWPDEYKPTPDDRIRELVEAGALIAAEIDRLLRLEAEDG